MRVLFSGRLDSAQTLRGGTSAKVESYILDLEGVCQGSGAGHRPRRLKSGLRHKGDGHRDKRVVHPNLLILETSWRMGIWAGQTARWPFWLWFWTKQMQEILFALLQRPPQCLTHIRLSKTLADYITMESCVHKYSKFPTYEWVLFCECVHKSNLFLKSKEVSLGIQLTQSAVL